MRIGLLVNLRSYDEKLRYLERFSYAGAKSILEQLGIDHYEVEDLSKENNIDLLLCPQCFNIKEKEIKRILNFVSNGGMIIVDGIFTQAQNIEEAYDNNDLFDEFININTKLGTTRDIDDFSITGLLLPNYHKLEERKIFHEIYPSLPILGYFKVRHFKNKNCIGMLRIFGTSENPAKIVEDCFANITCYNKGVILRLNPSIFTTVGIFLHRFTTTKNADFSKFSLLPITDEDKLWRELLKHSLANIPIVDEYVRLFRRLLLHLGFRVKKHLVRKYHLPHVNFRIPSLVCILTHDVDQVYTENGKDWFCFNDWIKIEREVNAKSAFYFLCPLANIKYPMPCKNYDIINDTKLREIIKYLRELGYEVSLHSAAFWNLEIMKKEKENLEEVLGEKIFGTRQHYLMITPSTLRYRSKIGFIYDTSLYKEWRIPTFLTGTTIPYTLYDIDNEKPLHLLEFSNVLEDGCIYGFYDEKERTIEESHIIALNYLQWTLKHNGVIVLNWHQRTCKLMGKIFNWALLYRWLIHYLRDKGSYFILPKDFSIWWKLRERVLINYSDRKISLVNTTSREVPLVVVIEALFKFRVLIENKTIEAKKNEEGSYIVKVPLTLKSNERKILNII